MAKKDKKAEQVKNLDIYAGLKCYRKKFGGSHRFPNRIIKPGQTFWIHPSLLPKAFVDVFEEVAPDYKAVIVTIDGRSPIEDAKIVKDVPEKFEMVQAKDEDGNVIKKGDAELYNIIGEDGKAINEKPLRKNKAQELLDTLNV